MSLDFQKEELYSNKEYKKLGDRIRKNIENISEYDYEMLQYLRLSYKEPMSIIFNSIKSIAHKVDSNCVCTYRIKRIESIISKLARFPKMQVNRAEDIAGCRCILSSETDVYKLYNKIKKKQDKLPFEIKGKINDYIKSPKESGYKSIHLNVVLKNDNRRVEIQLRSIEQHNWATLVEITDLLYGLKLKENGSSSNKDLFKLHYLLSKPQTQLTTHEINYIADTIINYKYIQTLGGVFAKNYINVRQQWNSMKLKSKHFFLISTGQNGIPEFHGFSTFDDAESNYFNMFINNNSNKNIVLTHIQSTNFAKISAAYSNYFLTYNDTIIKLLIYLSKAVENSYKKNNIISFRKFYQAFLDIMLFWMNNQIVEIEYFNKDNNIKKSKRKYYEWETNIKNSIYIFNDLFYHTQSKLRFNIYNFGVHVIARYKHRKFKKEANKLTIKE